MSIQLNDDDLKLLQTLNLSAYETQLIMDRLTALHAEIERSRRLALLDASSEVASHWSDRMSMVRAYDQAQRSAGVLQRIALANEIKS